MQQEVFEIIDKIEKLDIINELKKVKEEIRKDDIALSLIKKFNNAKEMYEKYKIKDDYIKAKKELMNNDLIKKYLNIQSEINMLTLYINNRINEIINNGDKDESNKW